MPIFFISLGAFLILFGGPAGAILGFFSFLWGIATLGDNS